MNAAYPAFVRSRLPKYSKPAVERIDNLAVSQALGVFEDAKIRRRLKVIAQVGLSYLTLG